MPTFDRRRFLIGSGVLGALGVLGGTAAVTWQDLAHLGESAPLAPGSRVLVILTMYGGNDGINTVIPYSDNAYHDARPELSYRAEDVLHLDDRLGLNPALQGMRKLWDDKKLAIVRGVGYPKPDHSHFRSMDIWQTASPDQPVPTGWIGRWLDSSGDDPVRAVHVGPVLPQLAIGAKQTASTLNPASAPIPPRLAAVARDLAAADPGDSAARASVCGGYAADATARTAFPTVGAPRGKPAKSADPLATQLETVARCIRADVPTRVYSVALGGFDTHAAERDTQQRLLGRVD
ncbi:MAG: DUF1501 domain-containing protein, partial [Nocardia sp.]|nr:DUF1501 domain-containing protein [Nocardia sp.]